jgi:dTDP-4-amino-4,6-dideoxygalactose transaminase
LFDLRSEHDALRAQLRAAFERVLDSSAFILGSEVTALEEQVSSYLGARHAVGLSNGSDALYVALLALGIGPGDEVITTPFTFVATAEAILRCGATPVFADIDPENFCLCPASTKRMRTARTKAVLTVHLYGSPGTVEAIARYCDEEGLSLIEDACQAFGARVAERAVGTLGAIGVYSFFPTKPLGGFGDGGLVVTASETIARTVRSLRSHGVGPRGNYNQLGGNFRLDSLQAALVGVKLAHVNRHRAARTVLAQRYDAALAGHRLVRPPARPALSHTAAWSLYTVRVPRHRDTLAAYLATQGIETRSYYPHLLSAQPLFTSRARSDKLPCAEAISQEVLSLPIYSGLEQAAQDRVIDALLSFTPGS